ncbi:hypothetical protein [Lewinella sp. 4G2]|uniref:hypothetical protein n=1 Tax=Lewinella sp. 4G2 TaxID=1803372 RepID=UPI0007B46434|nr:hypothetical protein [Lewinella sp. 4G2]OAV43278.1 hypothetical protein A3850_001660 [Lewinella sp. 4G2]
MDFLFTALFIYLAYRGYTWYQNVQAQVKGAPRPPEVDVNTDFHDPRQPQPGDEDDYIDYEEIKDEH